MAFCEMCGTHIPDGQTRCANCAEPKTEPQAEPKVVFEGTVNASEAPFPDFVKMYKDIVCQIKAFSVSKINWIGIGSILFMLLTFVLPVIRGTWVWELGSRYVYGADGFLIPFALIIVFLLSPVCYVFRLDKIGTVLGVINLVAFLAVWIPFGIRSFHIGIVMWLLAVIIQLSASFVMKILDYYVFKR